MLILAWNTNKAQKYRCVEFLTPITNTHPNIICLSNTYLTKAGADNLERLMKDLGFKLTAESFFDNGRTDCMTYTSREYKGVSKTTKCPDNLILCGTDEIWNMHIPDYMISTGMQDLIERYISNINPKNGFIFINSDLSQEYIKMLEVATSNIQGINKPLVAKGIFTNKKLKMVWGKLRNRIGTKPFLLESES